MRREEYFGYVEISTEKWEVCRSKHPMLEIFSFSMSCIAASVAAVVLPVAYWGDAMKVEIETSLRHAA